MNNDKIDLLDIFKMTYYTHSVSNHRKDIILDYNWDLIQIIEKPECFRIINQPWNKIWKSLLA